MNFRFKRPFIFILCGLLVFITHVYCAGRQTVGAPVKEPPRAMWVWDVKIAQDKDATERLINFCKQKNINLLFYTAYNPKANLAAGYRKFNRLLHENNISVHALAGDPRWALEKYHNRCLEWVKSCLEFNNDSKSPERFDGIHSDVEPYLVGKQWEADNKGVLIQYIQMNKNMSEYIKQSGQQVTLAADVPFWYDDDVNMWVEYNNKISPANYHILDIMDEIAVMDYRNFAEGENGSITLARNEIGYAGRINKKVYIGQETQDNLTPDYITFAGTDVGYMEGQIQKLVSAYINNPGFAGIAMHHYISYKRFLRKNEEVASE